MGWPLNFLNTQSRELQAFVSCWVQWCQRCTEADRNVLTLFSGDTLFRNLPLLP